MKNDMELAKQVISLSLAKRLKELGVKQDSIFYWAHGKKDDEWAAHTAHDLERSTTIELGDCIAAFTVAELGEMLPDMEHHEKPKESPVYISTHKVSNHHWRVSYSKKDKHIHQERAETEAEARGLMLAYLIENKLLTPNEEV